MPKIANQTLSLQNILKEFLERIFQEVQKNTTIQETVSQETLNKDDMVGAVLFIMIIIAIFSFFTVSILVIAVKSRSFEQLEDPYNNCFSEANMTSLTVLEDGIRSSLAIRALGATLE
uniref:Uncharacterized protein n=1 Tax=Leptobrachium leishanense TaxID=445787 RepID=A0A8C5MEK6_9ANUR